MSSQSSLQYIMTPLVFIALLVTIVTGTENIGDFNNNCGYQYEPSTGSCYKAYQEMKTWDEAYGVCRSDGGGLAVPNNKEETLVIKRVAVFTAIETTQHWYPVHIGIRDWFNNGTWLSVYGESLKIGWEPNQPSQDSNPQSCTTLIYAGTVDNGYCGRNMYFVCEKTPQLKLFHGEHNGNIECCMNKSQLTGENKVFINNYYGSTYNTYNYKEV